MSDILPEVQYAAELAHWSELMPGFMWDKFRHRVQWGTDESQWPLAEQGWICQYCKDVFEVRIRNLRKFNLEPHLSISVKGRWLNEGGLIYAGGNELAKVNLNQTAMEGGYCTVPNNYRDLICKRYHVLK